MQQRIPYITIDDVLSDEVLAEYVYPNIDINYYWSDDYSEEMYIALARAGFISVSHPHEQGQILLPELQEAYAVLDFDNIRIGKRVRKLIESKRYRMTQNNAFDQVLSSIQKSYKNCWMRGEYAKLMQVMSQKKYDNFSLISTELYDDNGMLVAGEIGYFTRNVYTSLSGFHIPEKKYDSWGTLQLVLLAKYLQEQGTRFWNLGHPYMQYKLDLGAKVLERKEFLQRWITN